jgi:HPt (histidine-containing phosphotransfer) domain-containing protein
MARLIEFPNEALESPTFAPPTFSPPPFRPPCRSEAPALAPGSSILPLRPPAWLGTPRTAALAAAGAAAAAVPLTGGETANLTTAFAVVASVVAAEAIAINFRLRSSLAAAHRGRNRDRLRLHRVIAAAHAISRCPASSSEPDTQDFGGRWAGDDIVPSPQANSPDPTPVLDEATLMELERDIGDAALPSLLDDFDHDLRTRLLRITAATAAADLHRLAFESHAISGCSSTFGALRLAQLCHDLESAADQGDRIQVFSLAERLPAAGNETLIALSQHRSHLRPSPESPPVSCIHR